MALPLAAVATLEEGSIRGGPLARRGVWSLADIVESRAWARLLLLIGATQAVFVSRGWPGWPCPLQEALGLPCPGCGLSLATAALLRGQWDLALHIHPFVPLVLVFLALVFVGALAPPSVVFRLGGALRVLDRRTRATFILATAFLVYGLLRLAVAVPFVWRVLL